MDAIRVLQDKLDKLGAALVQNDLGPIFASISFPFKVSVGSKSMDFANTGEFGGHLVRFRAMLANFRITESIRIVNAAEFRPDGGIVGTYTTHFLSGGFRVFTPFETTIGLEKFAQDFRLKWVRMPAEIADWPLKMDLRNLEPET